MSRRKSPPNRVQEVRESEGLSRAALARSAGMADRTLQRMESGAQVAEATKGKLVKALNRLPDKLRDYTVDYLFSNERRPS